MASEHGATFEPDEHIATLVLRHVGDVRDRLALECVSSVWRAVGQIPGVRVLATSPRGSPTRTSARCCAARGPTCALSSSTTPLRRLCGDGLCAYAALVDEARGLTGARTQAWRWKQQ